MFLALGAIWSLSQLLNSPAVGGKQFYMICKDARKEMFFPETGGTPIEDRLMTSKGVEEEYLIECTEELRAGRREGTSHLKINYKKVIPEKNP